jgi:hypothetical protein
VTERAVSLVGFSSRADDHRARRFHSVVLGVAVLIGAGHEGVFIRAGDDLTAKRAFYR